MDFILWILSWFESPIFVILFLISIPAGYYIYDCHL